MKTMKMITVIILLTAGLMAKAFAQAKPTVAVLNVDVKGVISDSKAMGNLVRIELEISIYRPSCVAYVDARDAAWFQDSVALFPHASQLTVHEFERSLSVAAVQCRADCGTHALKRIVPHFDHGVRRRGHNQLDALVGKPRHVSCIGDNSLMITLQYGRFVLVAHGFSTSSVARFLDRRRRRAHVSLLMNLVLGNYEYSEINDCLDDWMRDVIRSL